MKRTAIIAVILTLAAASTCCADIVYVKWNSPGPTLDGVSWDSGFHTVSQGIAAAVAGDEIRVAQGTYVGQITLKDGTSLLGGWSGVGDERDPKVCVTTLDGNWASNAVVTVPAGATTTTGIDGFKITKGAPGWGGGIRCENASPAITNNLITGNGNFYACTVGGGIYLKDSGAVVSGNTITHNVTGRGAGIYCEGGSPLIMNNVIAANAVTRSPGGGGIHCQNSSAMIANNIIYGNTGTMGGGIYVFGGSTSITNNTIVANADSSGGGGVYLAAETSGTASVTMVNNIIAFGSSGIHKEPSVQLDVASHGNCVYGNMAYDYEGIEPGATDISKDPQFACKEYGNFHIQQNSPCRDAGDDAYAQGTDIDGQGRIQGAHVDIGADESDGTTWSYSPGIIRVKSDGNDAFDGSTWLLAKKTVQAAINALGSEGGEVWVRGGTYTDDIILPQFIYLYGGFTGIEETRDARNWAGVGTFLESGSPVVKASESGFMLSAIDGFTIRTGSQLVTCQGASPLIVNDTITGGGGMYGGGIFCQYGAPVIANSTISDNTVQRDGGGIYAEYCRLFVSNCRIRSNRNTSSGYRGGGVYCVYSSLHLMGNVITGNTAMGRGGGLDAEISRITVTNNSFIGNTCSVGGAISSYVYYNAGSSIRNNIVANNSSGIYGYYPTDNPIFTNNCFHGNTSYDTVNMPPGTDNIFTDPLFADADYHISSSSPCINAGCDTAASLPTFDMDKQGRIFGPAVDIGADEYWSSVLSIRDVKKAADGAVISGSGAIVSAVFGNTLFYIEADNRSCGIRVEKPLHGATENTRATVSGTVKTRSSGERYIGADTVSCSGSGSVGPLAMTNRNLGGGDSHYNPLTGAGQQGVTGGLGLNNIGLLVSVCGRVLSEQPSYFMLDDGSGVQVKVLWPPDSPASLEDYVIVTGISQCEKVDGVVKRVVRPRRLEDIVVCGP
jgi:putative cofactor-binding repeat protein